MRAGFRRAALSLGLLLAGDAYAISGAELAKCLGTLGSYGPDVSIADRIAFSEAVSLERLRKKFPDVESVTVRPTPRYRPDSDGWKESLQVVVRRNGIDHVVGETLLNVEGDEIKLSSTVRTSYREAGLNRLMLLKALADHPEVRRMKSDVMFLNKAAFIVAVASEAEGVALGALVEGYLAKESARESTDSLFIDEYRELSGKKAAKAYRERILAAYLRDTSVGRLAAQAGLGHLRSILVTISRQGDIEVETVVERGPYLGNTAETRLVFADDEAAPASRYREILPDGTARRSARNPLN